MYNSDLSIYIYTSDWSICITQIGVYVYLRLEYMYTSDWNICIPQTGIYVYLRLEYTWQYEGNHIL